jgi:hypothetical protein
MMTNIKRLKNKSPAQVKKHPPALPAAAPAPQAGRLSCWLNPPSSRWLRNRAKLVGGFCF